MEISFLLYTRHRKYCLLQKCIYFLFQFSMHLWESFLGIDGVDICNEQNLPIYILYIELEIN